jgi:hypothetical protein
VASRCEPCENCGRPIAPAGDTYLPYQGWVEHIGLLVLSHTPARCWEASHSNTVSEGEVLALSFESKDALKDWSNNMGA